MQEEFKLIGVVSLAVAVFLMGLGTERFAEVGKKLSRIVGGWFGWEGFHGDWSFMAAAAIAVAIVFLPDFNVLDFVNGLGFEEFDPGLAKGISSALVLLVSNFVHDKRK